MWPFQFYSQELKEFGYRCECVWIKEDRTEIIESGYSFDDISYFIYAKGPNVNYLGRAANVPIDMHFDIWRISTEAPVYIGNIPRPLTMEEKQRINYLLRLPSGIEHNDGSEAPDTVFSAVIDWENFYHEEYQKYKVFEVREIAEMYGWEDTFHMRDIHMPIPDYTLLP